MIHPNAERTLRTMGERGDIIRTMQRAMGDQPRELAVFESYRGDKFDGVVDDRRLIGRVLAKGLHDESNERGYLIIDGVDGKAHYAALTEREPLANYPIGAVVEVRSAVEVRPADKNIAELAKDGLYRTDHHLAIEQERAKPGRNPQDVVTAHVRRLESLQKHGIVECVSEGVWKVPENLVRLGRLRDLLRQGEGVIAGLKSHLPIEQQVHTMGATWLDQQLINGGKDLGWGGAGFGSEVRQAMQQRADFLVAQGLAQRRGQRVILARNLLDTLRKRELAQAGKDIAAETGLEYRPTADGQRVAGTYRRYAMLDDGTGFSLVPWRPVLEQKLGQSLAARVRGTGASWELGKQRGPGI